MKNLIPFHRAYENSSLIFHRECNCSEHCSDTDVAVISANFNKMYALINSLLFPIDFLLGYLQMILQLIKKQ